MIRFWRRDTFGALRIVPFRWLLAGRLTTFVAWQFGSLAQNWLVYTVSGSALTLGWVSAGWSVATIIFSLVGGIVANRMEKRRLMLWGQAGLGIIPLVVLTLALLGHLPIWVLAIHSLVLGLLFSFIMPARESYTTELMGRRTLLNAMALGTMGMALMGILSSTRGGVLVDQLGAAVVLLVVSALYGSTAVLFLQLPHSSMSHVLALSVGSQFVAGIRYVVRQPILLIILGVELGRVLSILPYQTFLPIFAADVFQRGVTGLGVMSATSSLGGLLGSLLVASLGDYRRRGRLLLRSGGASAVMLLLFARTALFYPALVFLLLLSMANNAYMVVRSALLRTAVTPRDARPDRRLLASGLGSGPTGHPAGWRLSRSVGRTVDCKPAGGHLARHVRDTATDCSQAAPTGANHPIASCGAFSAEPSVLGVAAPKPPLAIPPLSKLRGILASPVNSLWHWAPYTGDAFTPYTASRPFRTMSVSCSTPSIKPTSSVFEGFVKRD